MQVPDGGPVFPDCGFSGHGQNFVAASLACAQVLHRAGGAPVRVTEILDLKVMSGDIKVLPIYAIFLERGCACLVYKPETEILDSDPVRVKPDCERGAFFLFLGLVEKASYVAAPFVFRQDEHAVVDTEPFYVERPVIP